MDILFIYPAESEGFEPPIRRNAYTAFRVRLFRPLRQLSLAFGNKIALVYTAPLNKRATCASALPITTLQVVSGTPKLEIFEKRVQRYCFFLTYANKSAFFLQKRCLFGFYLVKTGAKDTSNIRNGHQSIGINLVHNTKHQRTLGLAN